MRALQQRRGRVRPIRKTHRHRHHVRRLEAHVDRGQAHEALDQQPGADQQDQCERDFTDDEGVAEPVGAPRAPGRARRVRRPGPCARVPCSAGARPEPHAADEGHAEREGEHPSVDLNLAVARQQAGRGERQQRGHADQRDQRPARRAQQRNHGGFGEQLSHHAPARGAERQPRRNFLAPRQRADHQQVRDVGARDQQHQRHGASEDQQRRPHLADHRVLERRHSRDPPAGRRPVACGRLLVNASHAD